MTPEVWMLGIFGLLAVAFLAMERLFAAHPQPVFRTGFGADLIYAPLNVLARIVFNGTIALGYARLGHALLPSEWAGVLSTRPVWLQALVLLVVLDVLFYFMHRLKHRWHWWWRLHETHHSSVDLDFFSSVRFHPLEKILDRSIFLTPIFVLGPSDWTIVVWSCTDAFFGMFIHANVTWRIGWLKYVFVGPEMHRWHHVADPALRECNYGNNFSFCDWIFGTAYVSERDPAGFGLEDAAYPAESFARQFTHAFRPRAEPSREDSTRHPRAAPTASPPARRGPPEAVRS